jgi:hypothetical protein
MTVPAIPGTVVLGDMRDIHHHGCEAVMHQLITGLTDAGLPPSTVLTGLDWEASAAQCLAAPLVVINGEGALHHARPCVEHVLALAEQRRAAGRPTALVNASWFANTPEQTQRLAAFDLVALRDGESRRMVQSKGILSLNAPDLAIRQAMQWHAAHPVLLGAAGGTAVSDSTRTEITRELRAFAARRGWKYLPVLYPPAAPRPGRKSRKIWRKLRLARVLGPLARWLMSPRYHAHLAGVPDMDAYCSALSHCQGVLAGRFHTVCFGLGLRIPVAALASNTPKIESLLADAGLDARHRMIALESLTAIPPFTDSEIAALDRFLANAEEEYARLFHRLRLLVAPAEAAS